MTHSFKKPNGKVGRPGKDTPCDICGVTWQKHARFLKHSIAAVAVKPRSARSVIKTESLAASKVLQAYDELLAEYEKQQEAVKRAAERAPAIAELLFKSWVSMQIEKTGNQDVAYWISEYENRTFE